MSGNVTSIDFRSRGESAAHTETLPEMILTSSVETDGGVPGELGVGAENTSDDVPL